MVRHGASHKIKCFKVLLYTRSKAKTRCDFGKAQGLARRKGKKERVTPEFGERKEEKNLPPNSGRYTIKAKELEAQRQVALVVSPAEATTSATSSLTSGGNHLSTDDSGHLCTGGLPATTAASPRAERSSPPSSYGGEDKTIQERGCHLHGVQHLVQPPGRR
jgi:hypothetical protein